MCRQGRELTLRAAGSAHEAVALAQQSQQAGHGSILFTHPPCCLPPRPPPAFTTQAAHLAKADLATATVMEMTALAGIMGRHYALQQGLAQEVADAIFEAALPRQAGDQLPTSAAGILVAVADRLDSLVGLGAAVGTPSAAADPYGMRRSAYGMLQALVANRVPLSLKAAVALSAASQPISVSGKAQQDVVDFVQRRLQQLLEDAGCQPETGERWLAGVSALLVGKTG